MAKVSKQELEWGKLLDKSTSPEEILDLGAKLQMKFTPEKAAQLAELHKRSISLMSPQAQNEPEKGYLELLLKLVDTENSTEREAIYDEIAEHETRRMQEVEQKKNEALQDILARWGDTTDRQEFIKLGLLLDPKATEEEMSSMFDQVWSGYQSKEAARMDDKEMEKWLNKFYEMSEADTLEEQKALLQKIYDGTLTSEEMEKLFPKD